MSTPNTACWTVCAAFRSWSPGRKSWAWTALALTDHGVMYGAIQFYQEAKKAGIKPIIGCEVYVAQSDRFSRNTGKDTDHLILLAKNLTGYHNLIQLVSKAHLESFYYKPRLDKELIKAVLRRA